MTRPDLRWAREYLRMASNELEDANRSNEKNDYAKAVRHAAQSVEYSVKAALYLVGIQSPDKHHDYALLRRHRADFPREFRDWIEVWAQANEETQKLVVRARYGSREKDQLPSEIFTRPDQAQEEIDRAGQVLSNVREYGRAVGERTPHRE